MWVGMRVELKMRCGCGWVLGRCEGLCWGGIGKGCGWLSGYNW